MQRIFFSLGAGFALLAVATGAFAAHALKTKLSGEMLAIFEIGARYQMYHALGLIAVAWAISQWNSQLVVAAGWLFCRRHCHFFRQSLHTESDRYPSTRRHHADWRRGFYCWLVPPCFGGIAKPITETVRSDFVRWTTISFVNRLYFLDQEISGFSSALSVTVTEIIPFHLNNSA